MTEAAKKLSLVTFSLLLCLIVGELGIRFIGHYDADGNFYVRYRRLRPYHPQITATKETIAQKLYAPSITLIYDSLLGWRPKPGSKSGNGLLNYNSVGIRSAPSEYSLLPRKDIVRIAIFGDSFTHGDEVPFEQTWGHYLENALKKNGVAAEVINFGGPGYGMDQAFLRWREFGYKFSPDMVILGLQMENVKRNVNLIWPMYGRAHLPFSKPRFLLNGEHLELVNVPTVPPEKLPELMGSLENWHLAKYEHFFTPEDYKVRPWHTSKFLCLAAEILFEGVYAAERKNRFFYDLSQEPARLTVQIIREFKRSVDNYKRKFLIVHLPTRYHLDELLIGEKLIYSNLLTRIAEMNPVVDPAIDLLREAKQSSVQTVFVRGGHYTGRGNEIVAGVIAKEILSKHKQNRLALKH